MTCYIVISRTPVEDELYVSPIPYRSLNEACDYVYRSREDYSDADVILYSTSVTDGFTYLLVSRETGEIYDHFIIKKVEI